jgi:tetraacyldisaccharide 4'-kinase
MILLRILLFPFAVLYGLITGFRNFLYDKGILRAASFDIPVIAVGNLSVGGTGKTPQIEYLIRLLSSDYKVAVLSRGYKRKSEGFILADAHSGAETLGDEPFQYYRKFPNIQVAVDADRKNGIAELLSQPEKPEVILLDDAYQHRKVRAGFYILLTSYGDLYSTDFILPTGNLREGRSGARRADIVIVTKCPPGLSTESQAEVREKLHLQPHQQLYFTYIRYDEKVYGHAQTLFVSDLIKENKTLVAGIAKPEPFFFHLQNDKDIVLTYADHHHFSEADITIINEKSKDKPIITTEKDYVRLQGKLDDSRLFYLPIETAFLAGKDNFDKTINNYVGKSTADR